MAPTRWLVLAAGLSPYTLDLWEEVASLPGQEVTLFHVPRPFRPDYAHEPPQPQADRVRLREARGLASARTVIDYAREVPPSVVVCMGYSAGYNLMAAAALRRLHPATPVAYMSDTNVVAEVDRAAARPTRLLGLLARRLVLGNVFSLSFDLGVSNAAVHRLLGIAQGVELPLLAVRAPDDPTVLPLPSEVVERLAACPRPRVLCASRLIERKNVVALTRAWAEYVGSGGIGSLVFVGEGPLRTELDRQAARLPPDRMIVVGAVPFHRARALFTQCEASVLVSTFEPWGISVVESLVAGVPVLATTQVGAAWTLAARAPNAVLFTESTEPALRAGLERLLGNLEQHQRAARAAQSSLRDAFEVGRVAARLVAFAEKGE